MTDLTITTLDRAALRAFTAAALAALAPLAEQYGVVLSNAGGHFGGATGDMKIGIRVKDAAPREMSEFAAYAHIYGLAESDLGATFHFNGNTYRVAGLKGSSRKYPILAQRSDGKTFKFPASTVKAMLAMERSRAGDAR